MAAAEEIHTDRLILRRPFVADVDAIFERYATDPEVTRYLGWPRHTSKAQTLAFLAFSDASWQRWSTGPYLIVDRQDGRVLGGTGLELETPYRAATGYVLARDAWGRGVATEALGAMVALAQRRGIRRVYAVCHVDHAASARVLEKSGFTREGILQRYAEFPNLAPGEPADVYCYARIL